MLVESDLKGANYHDRTQIDHELNLHFYATKRKQNKRNVNLLSFLRDKSLSNCFPLFIPRSIDMDSNIYAPLSEACAKTLSDKLHDRRRLAAQEIEK